MNEPETVRYDYTYGSVSSYKLSSIGINYNSHIFSRTLIQPPKIFVRRLISYYELCNHQVSATHALQAWNQIIPGNLFN